MSHCSEKEDADVAPGLVLPRSLEIWIDVPHKEHVCGHTQDLSSPALDIPQFLSGTNIFLLLRSDRRQKKC